jgi:hypothetical protein
MIKTSSKWVVVGSGLGVNAADTASVNAALDAQRERNAIKPETRLSLWNSVNSAYMETRRNSALIDNLIDAYENDGVRRQAAAHVVNNFNK